MSKPTFVFFGSSTFSHHVLEALSKFGMEPILCVTKAKEPVPELPEADLYVVASFGKILPAELIYKPKYKTLNVHPSLLPKLRGPSPIQNTILLGEKPGVTIMLMDEKMDHGPILAQEEVAVNPLPDYYREVEEKLGHAGGKLLAETIPKWINGEIKEVEQAHNEASYTKLIKKEDADITNDSPELALRKIMAFEVWPRARIGELIVTKAHIAEGKLVLDKVIPPGRKEMPYADYLRGKRK